MWMNAKLTHAAVLQTALDVRHHVTIQLETIIVDATKDLS